MRKAIAATRSMTKQTRGNAAAAYAERPSYSPFEGFASAIGVHP
jgi:hypothetical protein